MLDLLKSSYGPSSPKIAQHLNSLALRHFHTSNDATASLACHREALSILEWNRSHALLFDREEDSKRFAVEMAVTLSDVANVLREGNDFLGSGEAYLESLNLFIEGVVEDGGSIRRVLDEVPLQMKMHSGSFDAGADTFTSAASEAQESNCNWEKTGPNVLSNTSSPYPSEEEGQLRRQMQHQLHLERTALEREIIGINLADIGTILSSRPEVQRTLKGIDQLLREMQYVKFVAQNAASSRRRRKCIQKLVVTSNLTSAIASLNMMSMTASAPATIHRMDSSSFSDLGRSVSESDLILEEEEQEDMTFFPPLPTHHYRSKPHHYQFHQQRHLPQDRRIRSYQNPRSSASTFFLDPCEVSPGAATIGESTPMSRPIFPASSRSRSRVGGRGNASTSSSNLRIVNLQRSKSWASTHSTQEEFHRFFSYPVDSNIHPPARQNHLSYHGDDGYDNDDGSSTENNNLSLSMRHRQSSYPSHGVHYHHRRHSYTNPKLYHARDDNNRNRFFYYPFRRPNLLARRAITSEEDYDRHVALSVLIIPLENALRCALHRFPGLVNVTRSCSVEGSFSEYPLGSSLSLQGLVDCTHNHENGRRGLDGFSHQEGANNTERAKDETPIHDEDKGRDTVIPSILPQSSTHDASQMQPHTELRSDVVLGAGTERHTQEVAATIGRPMGSFQEKNPKIISTLNISQSSPTYDVAADSSFVASTVCDRSFNCHPAASVIAANKNHPLVVTQISSTPEDESAMSSPRSTSKIDLNYTIPCGGALPLG